jgi:hypothetical protein
LRPPQTSSIPWPPERQTLRAFTRGHFLIATEPAVETRKLADESRASRGELTPQEIEKRRLEVEEPGITKVKWGEDGAVHLD